MSSEAVTTCLVNLVDLDPPVNGGAWRVARAVCQMLLSHAEMNVIFLVNWSFAEQFPTWVEDEEASVIPYIARNTLTPLLKALKPDFIISPLFGMQPFDSIPEFTGIPHIVSIPDTQALDLPHLFTRQQLEGRKHIYAALPHAARVITLSEYARERLIHHCGLLPQQIEIASLGADIDPHHRDNTTFSIPPQPYIFYPANTWAHKRHDLLFRTMKHIWKRRPEMHLVLTGGRKGDEIQQLIRRYDCLPDKVLDLGYVSDDAVQMLYQHAEALLFTSEYEGFGIPLVEAMQNGCPVICAPKTAIPEVVGQAALYVDSDDPAMWAKAFLEDLPLKRQELIAAGYQRAQLFTWERTKQAWYQILSDAGLPLVENRTTPIQNPLLSQQVVLAELNEWHRRIIHYDFPAAGAKRVEHLKRLLDQVEAIRLYENQSRWVRLPIIGYLIRLLLRFRNLGRMWNANSQLHAGIIEHINTLEMRIEKRDQDTGGRE